MVNSGDNVDMYRVGQSEMFLLKIEDTYFSTSSIKINYSPYFDNRGNYLYKIDKAGGSSEEYFSADDFYIDPKEEHVYIYDGLLGNILVTDLKGVFICRIKAERGYCFINLNNYGWLFYLGNSAATSDNQNFNNLVWYDEGFEFYKEMFPIHPELTGRRYVTDNAKSVFSRYDNNLYYLPLLSNYIYLYDSVNNEFLSKYRIEYGMKEYDVSVDNPDEKADIKEYLKGITNGSIPSTVNSFNKIEDVILFNFSYNRELLMCSFNEKTSETKLYSFGMHDNGLIFGPPSIYFTDKQDKRILSIMDGSLFDYCKNRTNNTLIEEINQAIGETEDPNPILVFYTIK